MKLNFKNKYFVIITLIIIALLIFNMDKIIISISRYLYLQRGEMYIPPHNHELVPLGDTVPEYSEPRMVKIDGTCDNDSDSYPGLMHTDEDWIYYSNYWDNNKLYKRKIDNTNVTRLNNVSSIIIGIDNGYIYYRILREGNIREKEIYKINTRGTDNRQIYSNEDFKPFEVNKGWIFGIISGKTKDVYKLNEDGTQLIKVFSANQHIENIKILGDSIYYYLSGINEGIYKAKLDGTDNIKILNANNREFEISGEWIYYFGEKDVIYKAKLDGTDIIDLNLAFVNNMEIIGDWIYYSRRYSFNRIKADGSQFTKFNVNNSGNDGEFKVIGDWIYYDYYTIYE